jgi:hypothetical protein
MSHFPMDESYDVTHGQEVPDPDETLWYKHEMGFIWVGHGHEMGTAVVKTASMGPTVGIKRPLSEAAVNVQEAWYNQERPVPRNHPFVTNPPLDFFFHP